MKPLTNLQRENLIRRVAQSLGWASLSQVDKDTHTWRAKIVVRDLEDVAVHGASAKRAAELVLVPEPPAEVAS